MLYFFPSFFGHLFKSKTKLYPKEKKLTSATFKGSDSSVFKGSLFKSSSSKSPGAVVFFFFFFFFWGGGVLYFIVFCVYFVVLGVWEGCFIVSWFFFGVFFFVLFWCS